MTPLLEIRGLRVDYGRGRRRTTAVDGVDLDIAAGETLALVGESGSGKTTIGNAVLGVVPVAAGTIRFDGEDIAHATPRRTGLQAQSASKRINAYKFVDM